MSKFTIDDLAAIGPELDEGDLRLVNGGRRSEDTSSVVIDVSGGGSWRDKDF
ncbi:putative ATP-grasp target RiPP [Thermopolyspora sp. NPDC052614]|uniref:putative ATP-grasp target RiPP n=1 Tax=Thermopolyspora sp. NPDC052614 TaxID=3155682 RepID=UPI0034475C2A